ncbi:MAG: XdhC family protein [Chloroflexota bacterium]|nr:XdhC family protein [Chloroflexota bacterium]
MAAYTGPMIDEALAALRDWRAEGVPVALATVTEIVGSAPRELGAKLAVAADGRIAGSVSGGCVEGDVVDAALQVLGDGSPRLRHYGISDEMALQVGLMCGGEIDVFVEAVDGPAGDILSRLVEHVEQQVPVARVIDFEHGTVSAITADGVVGSTTAARSAREALATGDSRSVVAGFVDVINPPPRLWVVGAGHVAEHLVAFAERAGLAPIVVDPRRLFAEQPRFSGVAVLPTWPDRAFADGSLRPSDSVVVLSHDPKIDEPALRAALCADVAYVGAIGSRRAQADRADRLARAGVSPERLARLHAPIGLDLGGRSPAEIALAIVAELVSVRRGGPTRRR